MPRVHPADTSSVNSYMSSYKGRKAPPAPAAQGAAWQRVRALQHGAVRDANGACCSWHCCGASRRCVPWQPPSPYLEDLTKSLVAPPMRRKMQLIPNMRVYNKTAVVSPYEPLRDHIARSARLRAQLQAEVALRHHRLLWDREVSAAAERVGVDLRTYNTLLSLQHRDITPEDYDVLQCLDTNVKPKTLSQETVDEMLPSWVVPLPQRDPATEYLQPGQLPGQVPHLEARDTQPHKEKEPTSDTSPSEQRRTAQGTAPGCCAPAVAADSRCYICLERFVGGQLARTLPCGHYFHVACIDPWLTNNSVVCPVDSRAAVEGIEGEEWET